MADKACDKLPCADHQRVFYSVAGFYCVVCLTMIGYMVKNDDRAQASERSIVSTIGDVRLTAAQQHSEMMERVSARIDRMNADIIQRLTRIETKVETTTITTR